jgi:hypothetical protein
MTSPTVKSLGKSLESISEKVHNEDDSISNLTDASKIIQSSDEIKAKSKLRVPQTVSDATETSNDSDTLSSSDYETSDEGSCEEDGQREESAEHNGNQNNKAHNGLKICWKKLCGRRVIVCIVFTAFTAASAALIATVKYGSGKAAMKAAWQEFTVLYKKKYATPAEAEKRQQIFEENAEAIQKFNEEGMVYRALR